MSGMPMPSFTGGAAGPSASKGSSHGNTTFKNGGLTVMNSNPWVTVGVVVALVVLVIFLLMNRKKK